MEISVKRIAMFALYFTLSLAIAVVVICLAGCSSNSSDSESSTSATSTEGEVAISATVKKDAKFDSADLDADAQGFADAGLELGDSCNVVFSNGFKLQDVPYYNGYYVKTGSPVIVAYPKADHVVIAYNNQDFWSVEGLRDGDSVKVALNEKAKYKTTQDALSQSYSTNRADYESDERFSNFRALKGGKLKENFLYRGASPVDNSRGRASITNSLVERAQIKTVLDLADSDDEINKYFSDDDFDSTYVKNLYDEGRVATLGMGANKDSKDYKESLATGLRLLLKEGGPAYIHCMEGKDRTGFVCMALEAFAGATYAEMRDDYMQTYANYYGITKDSDSEKYSAIVSLYFNEFATYLTGAKETDNLESLDYVTGAESYLTSCGLSADEIANLHSLIEN